MVAGRIRGTYRQECTGLQWLAIAVIIEFHINERIDRSTSLATDIRCSLSLKIAGRH